MLNWSKNIKSTKKSILEDRIKELRQEGYKISEIAITTGYSVVSI